MAEFYSARSATITPLPWSTFAPPFSPVSLLDLPGFQAMPDLPSRLRLRAEIVADDGHETASWLMRSAADELDYHRAPLLAGTVGAAWRQAMEEERRARVRAASGESVRRSLWGWLLGVVGSAVAP